MHRNSDDEHEGEPEAPLSAPEPVLALAPAPSSPRRTPPGDGNIGTSQNATSCSQAECNRESIGAPKPDNELNSNSRSMAVLPKVGENCPSEAPTGSSHAHMGPTPPPAPSPAPPVPTSLSPMPGPLSTPAPTTMPSETQGGNNGSTPRPSILLPLLRCAVCRLLLVAPTTLNCGHTVCSIHMNEAIASRNEDPDSPVREPSFGQCPVEGCRPRQPARVRVIGRPNQLEAPTGVTFTPAAQHSSVPPESSLSTSPVGRLAKLDVTISKLLELITTAARRSGPPEPRSRREDSPATDDEQSDRRTPPSGSDRASSQSPPRPHPSSACSFEKDLLNELTCEICFMLLCNPITTPCQHTFCSTCLERSLDHSTKCPLCRLDLPPNAYFYQHAHNEVIVQIIAKSFPNLLEERIAIADTDGRDSRLDTPIFVCQLSYPGMPTLLHFFEPRYRLMLRRCLASPTPRFGMVMPRQNANNTDGNDYGTMLEIKNVQMLSDGRSMVETYGTFRFRILERGTLDGYLVGRIERIDDYPPEVESEIERIAMMNPNEGDLTIRGIERSNQELVDVCRRFLDQLRNGTAPWVVQRLNNTYGPMPNDVASFSFWVALVLPIDEQEKAKLLPIRSPRMRLRLVVHWIEQLNNNWWFSSGTWIILQLFRR
ncbi:LON peptidase N-terminal domain and RING finger protein C14F5,10c [Schizosaccharomyces pombe 972h-] [Rhizoctonia solani]|uniref:LON peptidase N-terminal domain and RING finger protein C14F5,10c [Schizosaccharomyces pombe 972h-] n=1 Tax=Rhizoctonia solani TaxID=456999 RepID=A0A0K6FVJ6_9AGAM|nr:LON peptidase N-terminal domain and RING finger protein C14F5,10c [Schizosaccharomyces pombe 972h-] [Rhizoctonia solani]